MLNEQHSQIRINRSAADTKGGVAYACEEVSFKEPNLICRAKAVPASDSGSSCDIHLLTNRDLIRESIIARSSLCRRIRSRLMLQFFLLMGLIPLMGCGGGIGTGGDGEGVLRRYDVIQALVWNGEVVVGGSQAGAVVVSGDGGKSWRREGLSGASVMGLAACPDGGFVGIDFNHKVWSADRRGEGWRGVALDKPRVPLAVTCDGRGRWWVVGSGARIAVSGDRGGQWTVTDLQEDVQFTAIQFVDDEHGFVVGEFGHVVATEDGGATWHKISQMPGEFYPYAALFLDRREGFVSGIAGQILRTVDGGRTWNRMENASGAALYRLFMHDGRPHGVGAGGVIARLEDGTWRSVAYPDAVPAFLGSAASLAGSIVIGGPGGLRVVAVDGKAGAGTGAGT